MKKIKYYNISTHLGTSGYSGYTGYTGLTGTAGYYGILINGINIIFGNSNLDHRLSKLMIENFDIDKIYEGITSVEIQTEIELTLKKAMKTNIISFEDIEYMSISEEFKEELKKEFRGNIAIAKLGLNV